MFEISYLNVKNLIVDVLESDFNSFKDEINEIFLRNVIPVELIPKLQIRKPSTELDEVRIEIKSDDFNIRANRTNPLEEYINANHLGELKHLVLQNLKAVQSNQTNLNQHRTYLNLFCSECNIMVPECGLLKHLRTNHQLARGGKLVRGRDYAPKPVLDFTPYCMKLTPFNMREIFFRYIRTAYHTKVAIFRDLGINQVIIPLLTHRAPDDQNIHLLTLGPHNQVRDVKEILFRIPLNELPFAIAGHAAFYHLSSLNPSSLAKGSSSPSSPSKIAVDSFIHKKIAVDSVIHKKIAVYSADHDVIPKELHINGVLYTLQCMLGEGAYGKCFKISSNEQQELAVKILNKMNLRDYRHLIDREIEIMQTLNHEHVVKLIETFDDKINIFLIQPLCSKNTLRHLMKEKGFIEIPECRNYISQTLEGVKYLHHNDIIHRDLKLSNVFVDNNMEIKIGDFGLAINAIPSEMYSPHICGTPAYLAPEVVNRKGFRYESDIWAVGVMSYELLHGYGPFDHDTYDLMYDHIIRGKYSLPNFEEPEFRMFLKSVFQIDFTRRPSANDCLGMDFFKQRHPNNERVKMPLKHEEICVIPSHILGPNKMYVQLYRNIGQFNSFQFIQLQNVVKKKLWRIPAPNEYILALFKDQLLYRARIVSTVSTASDDLFKVSVFYVDYGNTECVDLNDIFEWDAVCDNVPFQALHCKIANIRRFIKDENQTSQIIIKYLKKYAYTFCKATILDSCESNMTVEIVMDGRPLTELINEQLNAIRLFDL